MTHTHVSHFGLKETGETETYKLFQGTKGACLRMLYAHGCEIWQEPYAGRKVLKDQQGRISTLTWLENNIWGIYLRKETWEKE